MLIWSHPGGACLLAERGIVRAHEFGTVLALDGILGHAREEARAMGLLAEQDARHIVDMARQEAAAVLAEARAEAAALCEAATQKAGEEAARGYADGCQDAVTQWHERFADLQASHAAALAGMEERLAGIVALAVERIVRAEPREALFLRALQGVRDALREAGTARLRVHPQDADAALAAISAEGGVQAEGLQVQVEPDATLAPGACVLESSIGRLDASLDVQLAGVRSALARATRMALADATGLSGAGETFHVATPADDAHLDRDPNADFDADERFEAEHDEGMTHKEHAHG
jgi:type III secretion protein L